MNPPHARYCARCGRPLPAAHDGGHHSVGVDWIAALTLCVAGVVAVLALTRFGGFHSGFLAFGVVLPFAVVMSRRRR